MMRHSRLIYSSILTSLIILLVPVHTQNTVTSTKTTFSTTTPTKLSSSILAFSDSPSSSPTTLIDIPISIIVHISSSSSPTTTAQFLTSATASLALALSIGDSNYQLAGCYENVFAGISPDPGILPITPPNSITVLKCLEVAANVVGNGRTQTGSPQRGTQYLTIANGRDCIGISTLPHTLHSLPSSFCSSPCLGDNTTSCGGLAQNVSLLYVKPVDLSSILATTVPLNSSTWNNTAGNSSETTPTFDKPADSDRVGIWIGIAFGLTTLLILVVGSLTWEQKRYNKKRGISKFPKYALGEGKSGLQSEMRKHDISDADLLDGDNEELGRPDCPSGRVFMSGAMESALGATYDDLEMGRDSDRNTVRGNGASVVSGTGKLREDTMVDSWNEKLNISEMFIKKNDKEIDTEKYNDLEFTTGVPAPPTITAKNLWIAPVPRVESLHTDFKSNSDGEAGRSEAMGGVEGVTEVDKKKIHDEGEKMGRAKRHTFEQWKSGVVPPLQDELMPEMVELRTVENHRVHDRDGKGTEIQELRNGENFPNGKRPEMQQIPIISISSPPSSPVNETRNTLVVSNSEISQDNSRLGMKDFGRFADVRRGSGMWGSMMVRDEE